MESEQIEKPAPRTSKAEQAKPAADRVKELEEQGITDKRQVAGILKAEHYNPNEAAKGMGLANMKEFLALAKKETPKANNGTKPPEGKLPDDQSSQPAQKSAISYTPTSEKGQALKSILDVTSGINPAKAGAALKFYEGHQEAFDANPLRLMSIIQAAGLSWLKARDITTEWLTQVNPDQVFQPFLGGPVAESGKNIEPWMAPYMTQQKPGQTFMDRLDAMQEKMMEYRMMGMMMKDMFGTGGEGGAQDEEEKKMDRQMNRMIMATMASNIGGNKNQGGPFGPMGMNPFMATEFEPVLDTEGEMVLDGQGNPVMRYKMTPFQAALGGKNGGGPTDYEPMKILAEALTNERDAKGELVTTFAGLVKDSSERQVSMMQERLAAMEGQDPLEMVDTILEKVHGWGFGQEGKSAEVSKMELDLKKWEHEQNTGLTKWIHEQKMAMEDKKYARQQMHEFSATLRDGMSKIGAPLAEAFGKGVQEGRGRGRNGNGGRSEAPRSGGEKRSLDEMSDDQILELYGQSRQSERVLSDAQAQILAQMKARGMKTPPGEITT